jgi:iron-sulfur cluster assembly protein
MKNNKYLILGLLLTLFSVVGCVTDEVFESSGVKVIVDKKSLTYLDGTELDFVKEGLNEGFEFNNPNIDGECGCGESFSV